jgi:hypothetical protein
MALPVRSYIYRAMSASALFLSVVAPGAAAPVTLAEAWPGDPQVSGIGHNVLFLWTRSEVSSTLLYRHSSDGGRTFEPARQIAQMGSLISFKTQASNGLAHVVWTAHSDVFYSRIDLNSGHVTTPKKISYGSADSTDFDITVAAKLVAIAWTEEISRLESKLIVSFSLDQGHTFTNPQPVATVSSHSPFSIAATDSNIYISTSAKGDVMLAVIGVHSAASPRVMKLLEGGTASSYTCVAASGEKVYVGWDDYHAINVRASRDGGLTFSPPVELKISALLPQMIASQNDLYLILDDGGKNVFATESTDGGLTFSDARPMSDQTTSYHSAARIFLTAGKLVITWSEYLGEKEAMVFRVSADRGRSFGKEERVPIRTREGNTGGPAAVYASDRGLLFAWPEPQPEKRERLLRMVRVPIR